MSLKVHPQQFHRVERKAKLKNNSEGRSKPVNTDITTKASLKMASDKTAASSSMVAEFCDVC